MLARRVKLRGEAETRANARHLASVRVRRYSRRFHGAPPAAAHPRARGGGEESEPATVQGIYNIVVGTAGHIDHGKSSLVRQLTGIDPDRLPEEKARGLTIDLGFAPLELANKQRVGIIDVPGHERFVKNMVAGASGIDLVMLVVAADDSVMLQTREHLDIMTLLGLERGIIVINKVDLVEPSMVDLVEEEIAEIAQGTFLEGARAFRVSAATGEGIAELRQGLEEAILAVPPRRTEGVFRMPVQRVFSSKGHGTVVTGVPVSGRVSMGDRLEILPPGLTGRVRGLQAYKLKVDEACAGHSTALNLTEIDYHAVRRGMVVATPGYFRSAAMVEATVRVLPHFRHSLHHQMAVRFHTGTIEVTGRMFLLDQKSIEPGQETFAQFRFAEPVVVAPGDRYVFRLESPMVTLGGGEILDRSTWRLKTGKTYVLEALERKHSALGSKEEFVESVVLEAPFRLVEPKEISVRVGMPLDEVKSIFATLEERRVLIPAGGGRGWFCRDGVELGEKRIVNALRECYERDSYRVHVPKLEVRDQSHLDNDFFEAIADYLATEGKLRLLRGGRVSLPERRLELRPDEQRCYDAVLESFRDNLFTPLRAEEIAQQAGKDLALVNRMVGLLIDEEKFVRVSPDTIVHKDAIEEGAARLRRLYESEGPFSASQARVVLDTSRKFIIPFLEFMDHNRVTRRVGDQREIPS